MNLDSERKAFEDEFRKINSDIVFWLNTWDEEMQGYNHPTMCWIWHMWCKSANREGYKLAPVEPSETMQEIGMLHIPTVDCQPYDAGMVYKAMIGACDDHT